MPTASAILFALAGSPAQDGISEQSELCRVCGHSSARTMRYERWQASSFTDQAKLRDWSSDAICEPCVWAHAWNVPPGFPPPEAGKKGVNLRLYSHFWCDGEYRAWNKANKAEMRAWLSRPKQGTWFAAIADTGQKHVLPWTPVNTSAPVHGTVRFEERDVRIAELHVIDRLCGLLTAGATKEEVETGQYGPRAWQLARPLIEAFEATHGAALRGGAWFDLALWLAQRDEAQVQDRLAAEKAAREEARRADTGPKRPAKRSHRAGSARASRRVSADEPLQSAQALGPAAGPDADRGESQRELGRVDDGHDPQPGTGGPQQLSIFDL